MGGFKPENYVVEYEDGIYGIGVEPEAKITGFFEILSLLTSVLDDLDQYSGDPDKFPTQLKASAQIVEHLEKLKLDWLVEKFKELPTYSKKTFLGKAQQLLHGAQN